MRLINVDTFEVEEFLDADIPEYAILSHTWGDAEVDFSEWEDASKAKLKDGYAKIMGAREQAQRDGFNHLWVDTCCIDKRSSAELSEAINSMFHWYKDSKICYVYLADVELHQYKRSGGDCSTLTLESCHFEELKASKWFTRGWTLQELLAPQEIRFFSRSWATLGTKESLAEQLSQIALIDVSYLKGEDLRTASIAQRMSWASRRTTKRREDMAYCLLGIFGINMPLLYGEGDKAFIRLQEEILKKSNDESIFAWWREDGEKPSRHTNSSDLIDARLGLLASSPRNFSGSASVVAWPEEGHQLNTTNTSVLLKSFDECPIAPPSGSGRYVRLQCRDLKRMSYYICIPVEYIPDLAIYCRMGTAAPAFVLPIRKAFKLGPLSGNWYRRIKANTLAVSKEQPIVPKRLSRPTFDIIVEHSFFMPSKKALFSLSGSFIDFRLPVKFAGANASFTPMWQGIRRLDSKKGFTARLLFSTPNGKGIAMYLTTTTLRSINSHQIGDSRTLYLDHVCVVEEKSARELDRTLSEDCDRSTDLGPFKLFPQRYGQTRLNLDGFSVRVSVAKGGTAEADSAYIVCLHVEPSKRTLIHSALVAALVSLVLGMFLLPHFLGWKTHLGHKPTQLEDGHVRFEAMQ